MSWINPAVWHGKLAFFKFAVALLLLLGIPGCGTAPRSASNEDVTLTVGTGQFPTVIDAVLSNGSNSEVRVWQLWNSWGWEIFTVELQDSRTGRKYVIRRNEDRDWTKNYPSFYTIRPGSNHAITLKLADGSWIIPPGVNMSNGSFRVRVTMVIEATPEARLHRIFIGRVRSNWT